MTLDFGAAHGRRVVADAAAAPATGNLASISDVLTASDTMPTSPIEPPPPRLTPLQWAICIIAAIGFAFDSYVLLMLPLIVRPALVELLHVPATNPADQQLGRHPLQRAGGRRRHLRAARRLPDRPLRPPARARLEHPALRGLGVRGGLLDVGVAAALLALLHVRRRLRRVRRGGRLAGGALRESEAARGGRRLHAGVRLARRRDGDRRLLPGRHLRRSPAAGSRRRTRPGATR